MKTISLICIFVFLTSCSITNYIPSKVFKECDYSIEKSPKYGIELNYYTNSDSTYNFQIVEKHMHNMVDLTGNEKFKTSNTANRDAFTTTFLGVIAAGIGVALDISPIYYIAGLCSGTSWIIALSKPKYSEPISENMLIDVKRSPVSGEILCPITKPVPIQEDIKMFCNNASIVVRSDKNGRFSTNIRKSFGLKNENSFTITFIVSSEKINISDTLYLRIFDMATNINSNILNYQTQFEIAEQYELAEKALWNSSSHNNKEKVSKGIYFLPQLLDRKATIAQIENQRLLCILSNNIQDFEIRKVAFNKLDNTSLLYLSQTSKDGGFVLACSLRLNRVNWKSVFNNTNKTDNDLSNIVRAASLVDNPQPEKYEIVSVCHHYIRLGEESHIPELCDLLSRFGDKSLAEDYMNCGNNILSDAGCEWGIKHGLKCAQVNGSHRVRWGEK